MSYRSKSQKIIPATLFRYSDLPAVQLTHQKHLTDYYILTDRKTKKSNKNKNKGCLAVGSAFDHEKSINKLQQVIGNLNSQKVKLILENQKIQNQNILMMGEICKAQNQQQIKYIQQILQKKTKVDQLKKQLAKNQQKYKKQLKKLELQLENKNKNDNGGKNKSFKSVKNKSSKKKL